MKISSIISNIFFVIKYVCKISPLYIFFIILSSILSSGIIFFNLYITRILFDAIFVINQIERAFAIIILSLFIILLSNILNSVIGKLFGPRLLEKIKKEIYTDLYRKSLEYNMEYFDNSEFYNEYFYVIDIAENSISGLINILGITLTSVISSIGLVAYLSKTDLSILLVTLVGVALTCITSIIYKKQQYLLEVNSVPERRKMNYINRLFYLKEYAKEMRVFENGNLFFHKYNTAYLKKQEINWKYGKRISIINFFQTSIQSLTNSMVLVILVIKALNKIITVSDFVVFQNGAQQLNNQLSSLINLFPSFYENSLRISKYRKFLLGGNISNNKLKFSVNKEIVNIVFDRVCYDYCSEEFLLKNISFEVQQGDKIAIVGNNGAGKSTIAKIICGLYQPKSGRVIYNNDPNISSLKMDLNTHIGAVFQDYQLFAFSIAENVLMRPIDEGTKENDIALVNEALKFVGLYEKIMLLPDGIDTVLTREFTPGGTTLSGGELQRLAIARAYAQNYDVIVFDEITSSIDPISESYIYELLNQLSKNKIVFFISHRLLNMKNMDTIFYIKEGQVFEKGTHSELININGEYAKMFKAQVNKYKYDTEE